MLQCTRRSRCRELGGTDRVNRFLEMTMMLDSHTSENQAPPGNSNSIRSFFTLATAKVAAISHVALVGNFDPRKCGIATFTTSIFEKLAEHHPEIAVDVYALDDPRQPLSYADVAATIACDDPKSYAEAARQINESGANAVWL